MIEKQSTLEWIDFILTIVLDSSDNEVNTFSLTQYQNIAQMLLEKKQKYISFINHQTLGLTSRRKIQHLLKQHHGSLLILLDQADIITARTNSLSTLPVSILRDTTNCIYELLTIIENRFGDYLDLDEWAPQVYVQQFVAKFENRINMVREDLHRRSADPNLVGILTAPLSTSNGTNKGPANFRGIFYQRDLVYGIEQILTADRQVNIDITLIEFLVYMNFNSRPFMNYYTQYLSKQINYVDSVAEKIKELLLRFKEFNQMHRKPGVKLLTSESDLKKVISNWFTQEISFLKEKLHLDAISPESASSSHTFGKKEPSKVMILLSVDQIGLFLRALDSLRVLKAKSLNAVFQSITPFLSTPRQPEISWDSMRSKSYAFEEKDKQAVIKVLESVIIWIKEY